MSRKLNLGLCFIGAAITLSAQIGYPGQYPGGGPYPGGPYPGGPYPGGGPYPRGGPYPGGPGQGGPGTGGGRIPGRGRRDDGRGSSRNSVITSSATGILRMVSGDRFVLEADDHRIITYATSPNTKIENGGKSVDLTSFSKGDHLTVDSTSDDQGYLTAVTVTFNMAGSAQDRADAARTWDLPEFRTNSKRAGGRSDDDRPVLRRSTGGKDSTADSNEDRPVIRRGNGEKTTGDKPVDSANAAGDASSDDAAQTANHSPATIVRPNDPAPDPDDPGRPEIRRGKPAPRPRTASSEPSEATPAPAAAIANPDKAAQLYSRPGEAGSNSPAGSIIPVQEDPLIVRAREAVAAYSHSLPNYLCKESITRYESENPKQGWNALDVITADLTVENGAESHKNIKVGSRTTAKSMEEVGGNWSTGQFFATLEDLFDPGTQTSFRKNGQETIQGRQAEIFKFDVKRESSHWRVITTSQIYYPAYRGSIWIDRETAQVLRIEMESRNIPPGFPLAKVESATDYDYVRLATSRQYLLPTNAEVLSCEMGSSRCARNRIEYRNYRRFGAESEITFDDKQ